MTWLISACITGSITLHMAFPAVLANYPERACPDCDGYFAPLDCNDLGKRYRLFVNGKAYTLQAADCASWQPPAEANWPQKAGRRWLGDVQDTVWLDAGLPMAPFPALLCEVRLSGPSTSSGRGWLDWSDWYDERRYN